MFINTNQVMKKNLFCAVPAIERGRLQLFFLKMCPNVKQGVKPGVKKGVETGCEKDTGAGPQA